jgi:hypothetical protein
MIKAISTRDTFYKIAGPKERKRAGGINFDHVKNILSQDGLEVPKEAIELGLKDESKLAITNEKLSWIELTNLEEEAKKRADAHETFLLIVGSALESDSIDKMKNKISTINSYLVADHELKPGYMGLNLSDLSDVKKIKELFNREYNKAEEWISKSKEKEESSKLGGYISNDVVYDFGDGWKVVYVPAAGEIVQFPGLPNTSHDRILEGDKNGLCLGSGLKYYQTNNEGKIYSVRDPENKPRVTIRIDGNDLSEAKGKNNNPPDVDGAIHANEWFGTIRSLEYIDNYDYRKFPPLDIDGARNAYMQDKDRPYREGWLYAWYKNGIPEIDKDVAEKARQKDRLLIGSGIGKTHYELVKPTVIEWCNKYLNNTGNPSVLFGSTYQEPEHEVYKTYRKLPEMIAAVEKLSSEHPDWFFQIKLQEFPEYRKFSDIPIKNYTSKDPKGFLRKFSDKEWAKPHLDDCAKKVSTSDSAFILENSEKEWARPYLDDCAKKVSDSDPFFILANSEKEWAKPYLDDTAKIVKHYDPNIILKNSEKEWAKPHLDDAVQTSLKMNPFILLDYFDKEWARQYVTEEMMLQFIEYDSYLFISKYSTKEWARPFLDEAVRSFIESSPGEGENLIIIKDFKDNLSEESMRNLKDYYIKRNYLVLLNIYDNIRSFFDTNDVISAYDIMIKYNPCAFFEVYSDEFDELRDLLEDRVEIAIKNCILKTKTGVFQIIRQFAIGNYYKYIPFTLKEMVRLDEKSAIEALVLVGLVEGGFVAKQYPEFADEVLEECASIHPKLIVSSYIKPGSVIDESYIDTAAINMIREDPLHVVIEAIFLNKDWAKKYLDFASKELINRKPKEAYQIFSNKNDMRSYNEEYANLAKRKMEEKTAFEKYPQLKKLSTLLNSIGIKNVMNSIKY